MNILIVESAAKARTLQGYLGAGWKVLATGGHVQTLPEDRRMHGKHAGKAYWINRPGELPSPPWVWTERGEAAVKKIADEARSADDGATFWIATDPDREGEFIAWCLDRLLGDDATTHRVTFQEVTKEAVGAAIERPRAVDERLVESALVRKFLDRLVGYRTSKFASSLVEGGRASMGRVQTPTLGFVVERELEREAHVPIPYFEVRARTRAAELSVRFHERDDADAWRDDADKVHPTRTFDGDRARLALAALEAAGTVRVTGSRTSTRQRRPDAPFTTDALLQAAGSRFGWSPRKTSALASTLYEAGHITYIRTDSTRLARSAVDAARAVVASSFGEDHLGDSVAGGVVTGPVQDAHEAVRPTRLDVPEAPEVDDDARRLYRLVRAHTLASQMAPSQRTIVSIEAACDGLERPLTGSVSWRTFAGWEAAYDEFLGDVATAPPAAPLEEGAVWPLEPGTDEEPNPRLIEDETRPPARYRPHTLIRAMKDAGIGRPSTYSSTVDKLEDRGYLVVEDGALAPTPRGRAVWLDVAPMYAGDEDGDGVVEELFSPEFTALMETELDRIAEGEASAPDTWETYRDEVRALHEDAQERKKAGAVVPRQTEMLARLLENAPEDVRAAHASIEGLTYEKARALISELREAGVQPAPTVAQKEYATTLIEELELPDDELFELIGVRDVASLRTAEQASGAIEALRELHDERRPPSAKQRRFVEDLVKQAGLTDAQAAALVGLASLDELTGGSEGTASRLIDELQGRVKAGGEAG